MSKRPIQHKNRGFTLIETLVAILVLMLAIVGPLSLYSRFVIQADELQRTYIANYLAQEGYYLLYQKLYAANNDHTTLSGCATPLGCGIDYDGGIQVSSCAPSYTACPLYRNNTSGLYSHISLGGTITPFTRTVSYRIINTESQSTYCNPFDTITTPPNPPNLEIQIVSTVRWTEESGLRSATLSQSIFDPMFPSARCISP